MDTNATLEAKKGARNDPIINRFMRCASDAEKVEYAAISGPGSQTKKRQFREMINSQKLVNPAASQQNISASAQADTKVGTYRNFWSIAEKEGGLMDRETGIRVAKSICTLCEKKGPPALMWDGAASIMKYLHCEVGVSDIQSKTRSSILSADVEMDEETIRKAMQMGMAEGLSPQIPPGEILNTPKSPVIPIVVVDQPKIDTYFRAKTPELAQAASQATVQAAAQGSDQTAANLKPDAPAEFNLATIAKQLLSKGSDSSSSNSLLSAVLLQQIISSNDKPSDKDKDKGAKEKAEPKEKTTEEKLWQECSALGRKLDGMTTHADSIVQQTKESDNSWSWAMNTGQCSDLATVIVKVAPVVHTWSSSVRTSTMGFMVKKKGSPEEAAKWLQAHKDDIEKAIGEIGSPLGLIVGMHAAMLKQRASEGKPKKKVGKK
jgi:hypothetical protein